MGQKCLLTIKTNYATRANSNVGKVVAKLTNGMQASVVIDQSLTAEANARRAAEKLAAKCCLKVARALDTLPSDPIVAAATSRYAWEYELEYT